MTTAMAQPWEKLLDRWVAAGVLDAAQAARIRTFEAKERPGARFRWPVVLALAFGALLLAAGILLFVSAHWDALSPAARFSLVLAMVAVFHAGGAFASARWPALAVSLHAVGSMSLGAGIALAGQIFNMAEHWPAAILMWAVGAALGWWLLRHWTQALLTALLLPFWLTGEWIEFDHRAVLAPAALLLLSFTYLAALGPGRSGPVRVALAWAGGLAVLPMAAAAATIARERVAFEKEWIILAIAVCAVLGLGWLLRGKDAWPNGVAAVWVLVLIALAQSKVDVPLYLWCAVGSAGLAGWGLQDGRGERINLGVAGFAVTVLVFYFSSVMDKLGRSASLIVLGLLFLGGGWLLERTRRRLVAQARGASV